MYHMRSQGRGGEQSGILGKRMKNMVFYLELEVNSHFS